MFFAVKKNFFSLEQYLWQDSAYYVLTDGKPDFIMDKVIKKIGHNPPRVPIVGKWLIMG
jgi:hypothetical protein